MEKEQKFAYIGVCLAVIICQLPFSSCQTIKTNDARTGKTLSQVTKKSRTGNFYFLPKVLVRVEGAYTLDEKGNETDHYKIKVSRLIVADKDAQLFAEYIPSAMANDTLNFQVNNKGLLEGAFSTKSADETASILESLATSAINLWQISSYGSTGGILANGTPNGFVEGPRRSKLNNFDVIFDPWNYRSGTLVPNTGQFSINLTDNSVGGSKVPNESSPKAEGPWKGLVFRAPAIIDLQIALNADDTPPFPGKPVENKSEQSDIKKEEEPKKEPENKPEPSTPPAKVAPEQKDGDIVEFTIFNAHSESSVFLPLSVKVANKNENALMPFSFKRAAFVKKETDLAFADGELMTVGIKKPSQIKGLVAPIENITDKVLAAFPAVIQINDARTEREFSTENQNVITRIKQNDLEKSLIDSENSLLDSQLLNIQKKKSIEQEKTIPDESGQ